MELCDRNEHVDEFVFDFGEFVAFFSSSKNAQIYMQGKSTMKMFELDYRLISIHHHIWMQINFVTVLDEHLINIFKLGGVLP